MTGLNGPHLCGISTFTNRKGWTCKHMEGTYLFNRQCRTCSHATPYGGIMRHVEGAIQ